MFEAPLTTFHDLFIHQLQDLYDAEQRLVDELPKMAKAATNDQLKQGFEEHYRQTKEHVARLEDAFASIGEKPEKATCAGMKGLLDEGATIMKQTKDVPEVCDAALIEAAQKVEHYEIAAYGTARTFAEMMGHDEAAEILQLTLDEESETNEKLNEIALSTVNPAAMEAASGMEKEKVAA